MADHGGGSGDDEAPAAAPFGASPTYDPSSPGGTPPAAAHSPSGEADAFGASPTYDPSSPGGTPPSQSPSAAPPTPADGDNEQQQQPEWEAVQDDEGRTYYYNNVTGESSWEAPPGFDGAATTQDERQDQSQQQPSTSDGGGGGGSGGEEQRWTGYKDDEGRTYYYNEATGETTWDRPADGPGVVVVDEEETEAEANAAAQEDYPDAAAQGVEEGEVGEDGEIGTASAAGSAAAGEDGDVAMEVEDEDDRKAMEEPEKDPKLLALENAKRALGKPDAVLEQDCLDNIAELVDQLGGNVGGPKAIQALVTSHQGLTAVCGLLSLWIAELRTTLAQTSGGETRTKMRVSSSNSVASSSSAAKVAAITSGSPADQVRSIAEEVVSRFAKEHFSVENSDNILKLSKAEAAFLEEMIENKRWRRLLIDLSATYKDSALLTYCLKSISKRGHHREIAKRINQSDYFGVFNSMLTSELEFLGTLAASGQSGVDETPESLEGVISDLRRTCTSTAYTYLYSREVLQELTTRASEASKTRGGAEKEALMVAVRRWTRLKEELEAAMVLPDTAKSSGTSTNAIAKKRRLDIAMITSDLHQRQRQRRAPNKNDSIVLPPQRNSVRDNLDTSVEKLVRKYAMGLVIDNEIAEGLLRASYGNDKLMIGDVLNSHPVALHALMAYLFKPGRLRVRSLEMRHRCAKLIALAALAKRVSLAKEAGGADDSAAAAAIEDNVDVFTNAVLKGSQLCEQIETMVTFTVVDEVECKEGASVGRQLSSLCIKNPAVAQGALLWSIERGSGAEFVDSAAYPTLAPSILSLARIISIHHPLCRPSVQTIAFLFLRHSPPELSFQKVQALKEQCLRLLLWLCTQGESVRVFSAVSSASLDSSQLRYFLSIVFQAMRPPFSVPLIRSLGALLSSKPCVDALRSSHFDASSKALLSKVISSFKQVTSKGGMHERSATAVDKALVATLISLYSS